MSGRLSIWRPGRSLTSRIVATIATIAGSGVFVATVAVAVLVYHDGQIDAVTETGASAAVMANQLSVVLARAAHVARENGRYLARDPVSRSTASAYFSQVLAHEPTLQGVWLIAEPGASGEFDTAWRRRQDGALVQAASDRRTSSSQARASALYLDPMRRDDLVVSQPYFRALDGDSGQLTPMTSVAVPVRVGGRLVGVTGVDLFLSDLSSLLLRQARAPEMRFALISDAGVVALSSDRTLLGKPQAALPIPTDLLQRADRASYAGVTGRWGKARSILMVRPVVIEGADNAWTLVVAEPTAQALAQTRNTLALAALMGLSLIGLAMLLARRLGQTLSEPITRMARTMRDMADGDMDAPVPDDLEDNELADMARALEAFRACAQDLVQAEAGRRAAERTAREGAVHLRITAANLPLDEFMALITHEAMAMTRADGAAVELLEEGRLFHRSVAGMLAPFDGARMATDSMSGHAMRRQETVWSNDCFNDPRVHRAAAVRSGVRSIAVTPLIEGGRTLGTLKVSSARAGAFTADDAGALQVLSPLIAAAMSREMAREAAEAANTAKSQFLANMSHEIRTPLNGVLGMADLLTRSKLSERDREMVEIIRSSGDTLDRLLSDILDLGRIEAGQMHIEGEPFHLGDAVRSVAALSGLKAKEKGVALQVEVTPEADQVFRGDVVRVRQVLTNLVSNAVKFTGEGHVTIRASAESGRPVRLQVDDTGVGFEPSSKEQVFGRFQQADGSITRRFGGTGLGLAISRHLATLMGGALECESTPGKGSSFWLELPLEPAEPAVSPEVVTLPTSSRAARVRVLAADDHPSNRKVVELIMAEAGAELEMVEDGVQALEAFQRGGFDIILMDMQMPVMDGLTATVAIRQLEAEGKLPRTPILMLTANALPEHVDAARKAGADGHVAKPITAAGLLGAVAAALPAAAEARSNVA
jgi:signal transduction histidine kinase/ActR/RegA family two-component response regulator/HAMP domain-containing protein